MRRKPAKFFFSGLGCVLKQVRRLQNLLFEDVCLGIEAGVATLLPSHPKFVVPFSIGLTTCIGRWKSFQRCRIIDVLTEDDLSFGWVRVREFSLRRCQTCLVKCD